MWWINFSIFSCHLYPSEYFLYWWVTTGHICSNNRSTLICFTPNMTIFRSSPSKIEILVGLDRLFWYWTFLSIYTLNPINISGYLKTLNHPFYTRVWEQLEQCYNQLYTSEVITEKMMNVGFSLVFNKWTVPTGYSTATRWNTKKTMVSIYQPSGDIIGFTTTRAGDTIG